METLHVINDLVLAIGLPAVLATFLFIGRKLQILDTLQESSSKIRHNLKTVSDYLMRHHTKFDPKELQALSPFQLTEAGQDFVEKSGFAKVFIEHEKDFFDYIEAENPKLKYDVETAAIKSMFAFQDKPYMDFLKVFFYNNPERNLENVAPTLGVYLRDQFLERHPEIEE